MVRYNAHKMIEFLGQRLEESGLYTIREMDEKHVLAVDENGRKIYVAGHMRPVAEKELSGLRDRNKSNGFYTSHIFYKDGDNFFRKMKVGNTSRKGSLKKYTDDQINRMIELKDSENDVLNYCPKNFFKNGVQRLVYYNPEGAFPESILVVEMEDVMSDYTHIGRDHGAYGHVGSTAVLKGRKLTTTRQISLDPVHFELYEPNMHAMIESERSKYTFRKLVSTRTETPVQLTLF